MSRFKNIFELKLLVISFAIIWNFKYVNSEDSGSTLENGTTNLLSSYLNDEKQLRSTLFVGLMSTLIFSFIGILPALFIKNETDEEKFSEYIIILFI